MLDNNEKEQIFNYPATCVVISRITVKTGNYELIGDIMAMLQDEGDTLPKHGPIRPRRPVLERGLFLFNLYAVNIKPTGV